MRDYVGPDRYEYFSVKVTDATADLTISVTPFTGDPDVFVSPAPDARPNNTHHEWAATGFGKDSLTIQAEEMKEHCTPDPMRGVACEYFIGVLGWTNTSFSIQANLNRGWEDPMVRVFDCFIARFVWLGIVGSGLEEVSAVIPVYVCAHVSEH